MAFLRRLVHRRWFWIAVGLFALYSGFGFLVAPRILRQQILAKVKTELGREATLQDVDINPWTLAVRLQNFRLLDSDQETFVEFREFFVDFQVSSLFRRAFTFKTVRLLDPHVLVRLMPDERPNFQDLVDRAKARPAEPEPARPQKPPAVLLQRLEIGDARMRAANLASPHPEAVAFTPISLVLENFTTVPNHDGTYTLEATGQGGGRWEWTGALTFAPLRSSGRFSITREHLPAVWEVVRDRVAWEIPGGDLDLHLQYSVHVHGDSVEAKINDAIVALDRFVFREQGRPLDLLAVDSLRAGPMELKYPQQTLDIARVRATGVRAAAWLGSAGRLNWDSLLVPPVLTANGRALPASGPASDAGAPAVPPWSVHFGEVVVYGGAASFTDSTVTPPFVIGSSGIEITVRDLSSKPGSKFGVEAKATIAETGKIAISGDMTAVPPRGDVDVELGGLPLAPFQPYVEGNAKLELVTGDLGAKGRLTFEGHDAPRPPDFKFTGSLSSNNLLTRDSRTHEKLLTWRRLTAEHVALDPKNAEAATVTASGAYMRFIIFPDRRTNIQEVLGIPPRDTTLAMSPPPPPAPPPVATRIGVFRVEDTSMDFADLSLLLPFAAGIEKLHGEVRGLSSDPAARAQVTLDGRLVPAGEAQVRGEINPLSGDLYTDLTVDFRNFDMPALSPYTGQFLGRKVDQGKMQLALQYKVAQRELKGDNKVIIDALELGADVDSPEATHLPIGLAIALLKDRHGRIDLDVPVHGNLDNPKFSIWDAVWDVLRNILVKLVTSPFHLLGRLAGLGGGDDDQLSRVHFAPGSHELAPPEQDKVTKLGTALGERPALRLEVRGGFNAGADTPVLQEAKFVALAAERARRDPGKYAAAPEGTGFAPRLLRDLYSEGQGSAALQALEQRFQIPKTDKKGRPDPKLTVLDEISFYAALRQELAAAQPVDAVELRALAQERAVAIKNQLTGPAAVEESRIFLLEVEENAGLDDGQVRVELQLGG